MAETTVPTSGVEGYTPEVFESSGQKAAVNGDTLIIAAASKGAAKDIVPITSPVVYDLGAIGQSVLQVTGDLSKTYTGGLAFQGTANAETLVFGAATDVNGDKVKTKVENTRVDLSGGGSDNLTITGKTSVKKTEVRIDSSDTITNKKGDTFTSANVKDNGKIKGIGGITFEVV